VWHKEEAYFNIWQYSTVFQADVYAIKACAIEYRQELKNIKIR
jgi:hypothetical protein